MDLDVNVQIPVLWAGEFRKSIWSGVNYVVGPNGTGKSLLAEQIKIQFSHSGLKVRSLSAERLSGFEKTDYGYHSSSQMGSGLNISTFEEFKRYGENYGLSTSAFIILQERIDLRIRIEAILSDVFGKRIRLVEEGGFLKPKIQNILHGDEYGLKESECHGLKELITLLTFLYDPSNSVLILDEPELHLHPQFQSFFLKEVRALSGNPRLDPKKKLFFVITHSPYFLDFKTLDDLKSVIVCHYNSVPTFVGSFDPQDEYILKRFLPRFNTHHKQFFFSPNPVFVEGHTDQQLISLLLERSGINVESAGSSIIDVGGKDELAVFTRLCRKLGIEARSIADFDAVFRGKLRESVQSDPRSSDYFISQGFGADLSSAIGELERKLGNIGTELSKSTNVVPSIGPLYARLMNIIQAPEKRNEWLDATLLTLLRHREDLKNSLPPGSLQSDVDYVSSRYQVVLLAFQAAKVFIVPSGEIEHHYRHAEIDYLNYGKKDELFHRELDFLLGLASPELVKSTYQELINVVLQAVPTIDIDLRGHIKFQIIEWIQNLQRAIARKEVIDCRTMTTSSAINYALYSQLFDIMDEDLRIESDLAFSCKLVLKESLVPGGSVVSFDHKTIPHDFSM
jgi:hypothetical protein